MRTCLGVVLAMMLAGSGVAQASAASTPGEADLNGRWIFAGDLYGTPVFEMLTFTRQGDALSADWDGDKLEGRIDGGTVHLTSRTSSGGTVEITAILADGVLRGVSVSTDAADPVHPQRMPFSATPVPARPAGPPRHHEFAPTNFYRSFSPFNPPALTIAPGDSVQTTTVDAGGTDERGVKRVLGGNPQTGPFYVTSAAPGDTLVVHILKLRLNRDFAVSDDFLVERAMDSRLAVRNKDGGKTVIWRLDREKGLASLAAPGPHTIGFSIPVHPMLGCVATAPSTGRSPPVTGDSGSYGGNMDFNGIVEGATLYLPVSVPGALLYLGDAHAAQGDGELTGNALETSMDVEFSVDVIPARHLAAPRVENAAQVMAMGLDGSIDGAFKQATSNMSAWLASDYGLTAPEVAAVLGSSAHYQVSEAADRNAGVVLKLDKDRLATLTDGAKRP